MRASKILERGQLVGGRIVGIHIGVSRDPDTNGKYPEYEYAIEVHSAPPFVSGVRQPLTPNNIIRLGMDVAVRHIGSEAVIDWHATCGGLSGEHIKLCRSHRLLGSSMTTTTSIQRAGSGSTATARSSPRSDDRTAV